MTKGLKGRLYTTVVGSFPYYMDKGLMKANDWMEVPEIKNTSFEALKFQLDCGIDFPSDGQFFDMVEMYLEPLKNAGFLTEGRLLGEGGPPSKHPSARLESELEGMARKGGAQGLRVPVTGPFTLAYRVKNTQGSLAETADKDGLLELGRAVKAFVKGFDSFLSGSILSVDEPVLPFVLPVFGNDFIRDVLNDVFRAIKRNYSCMHICGSIGGIKDLALSLDVEILDHEFQGTDNSHVYTREDLEARGKMLCYGVLNTNPRQVFREDGNVLVEPVSHIKNVIEAACKTYGMENLLISPDCGFGGWRHVHREEGEKWGWIKEKLSNMVRARDEVLGWQA